MNAYNIQSALKSAVSGGTNVKQLFYNLPFHCRFQRKLHKLADLTSCSWVSLT